MEDFILSDKNFKRSRLHSLYSDFSHLKQTNVEGYAANLTSWKFLLLDIISKHVELLCQDDAISFDSNTLVSILTVRDTSLTYIPKGLSEVLNSMINEDHTLVPLSLFKSKPVDVNGNGDGILRSIFRSIMGTSYCNHVTNFDTADPSSDDGGLIPNEKFICLSKLKDIAGQIKLLLTSNNPAKLNHLQKLAENNNVVKTQTDFDCCIQYLTRDTMDVGLNGDITYLLGSDGHFKGENISGLDLATLETVADLNYSIFKLQNHYDTLHNSLNTLDHKIHGLIREKRLKLAKSQLRIKKIVEKQLVENQLKLENLQIVRLKLQEAKTNVSVAETLKSNADLLKKINKEAPDADELDSILQDIGDELDRTTEISSKLGNLTTTETQEEENSIETELSALEKEEEDKNRKSYTKEKSENAEQETSEKLEKDIKPVSMENKCKDHLNKQLSKTSEVAIETGDAQIEALEERFKKLTLPKEGTSRSLKRNDKKHHPDKAREPLTA